MKQATVNAGGKVEISASLKRDFGFADEVKLQLRPPKGVKLSLDGEAKFAKGNGDAKVKLKADKSQKPGVYTVTFRAQIKFNNRNLTLDRTLEIKVEPAAGN